MAAEGEGLGNGAGNGAAGDIADAPGFDTSVAHPARIWDYWLGGKDNFAADREAAERVLAVSPFVANVAKADRAFLARVVHHLVADLGIRQFLDIGTGLPTANNTHEVAQRAAPDARIVYVDNDPIVLAHARALLTSDPAGATAYTEADARDTHAILAAAEQTLDLSKPIAVLLLGILLFIPDEDDPFSITARLMAAAAPGSYLAISHGASDIQAEAAATAGRRYNERSAVPLRLRSHAEVSRFFDGLEIAEPGIVPLNQWQPGQLGPGAPLTAYAALARKPA